MAARSGQLSGVKTTVHCSGRSAAAPDTVWAVLRDFDVGWHPFVTTCAVHTDVAGRLMRQFKTQDGGEMCERLTYLSHSDRERDRTNTG